MNDTNGVKTEQKKTTGYRTFNKLSKSSITETRQLISDLRFGFPVHNRISGIRDGSGRTMFALTNRGAARLVELYTAGESVSAWLEDRLDNAINTQENKFGTGFWNREGV